MRVHATLTNEESKSLSKGNGLSNSFMDLRIASGEPDPAMHD